MVRRKGMLYHVSCRLPVASSRGATVTAILEKRRTSPSFFRIPSTAAVESGFRSPMATGGS